MPNTSLPGNGRPAPVRLPVNLGGTLAPDQVVGRDDFIAGLWRMLEQQSVVLSAERRMGKTSIIRKMRAEQPPRFLAFFHDVEGVDSPAQFVRSVQQDIEDALQANRTLIEKTREILRPLGGLEVQALPVGVGVKLPQAQQPAWQHVLEQLLAELHARNPDRVIVFFWDEVPWMLQKIGQGYTERETIQLLDTLRQQRQSLPRLRMVFTGSIGLHHVIAALKTDHGYSNEPISDMFPHVVPPLAHGDAVDLASRLLAGGGPPPAALPQVADSIAHSTDGIPFFIHHVVNRLLREKQVTPEIVQGHVDALLTDDLNVLDLEHYDSRLDGYYGSRAPVARVILDTIASRQGPVALSDVLAAAMTVAGTTEQQARSLVLLMRRDHYLHQQPGTSEYVFTFAVVKRWWTLYRGI